jgi:hypothetical protein
VLNPLIYSAKTKEIRQAIIRIFHRIKMWLLHLSLGSDVYCGHKLSSVTLSLSSSSSTCWEKYLGRCYEMRKYRYKT